MRAECVRISALLSFALAASASSANAAGPEVELSGFAKNLGILATGVESLGVDATFRPRLRDDEMLEGDTSILRLRALSRLGDWLTLEAQWQASLQTGEPALLDGQPTGGAGLEAGLEGTADMGALPLQWELARGEGHILGSRIDWLTVTGERGRFKLVVGRQAISWGAGRFFTPTDLVSPFHPTQVDREVKPGVDALLLAWSITDTSELTVVGAAFDGNEDRFVSSYLAAARYYGMLGALTVAAVVLFRDDDRGIQDPIQVRPDTEPSEFRDLVAGAQLEGELFGVGLRAEGTWTEPFNDDELAFLQLVLSADYQFDTEIYAIVEYYHNGFGTRRPKNYLRKMEHYRFRRGEVFTAGRYYLAMMLSYPMLPELTTSVMVLANVGDPSALVGPGFSWSITDAFDLIGGAYIAFGEGIDWSPILEPRAPIDPFSPLVPKLDSEYGAMPDTYFLEARFYF